MLKTRRQTCACAMQTCACRMQTCACRIQTCACRIQTCACRIQNLPNHLPLIVQHPEMKTPHLCHCLILEKSAIKHKIGLILKHFQGWFLCTCSSLLKGQWGLCYMSASPSKCSGLGSQCERGSHLCLMDYLIILLVYASVDIVRVKSRNDLYL